MVLGVSKDDNELARGRLYGILTAYQAAVTRAEVQIIGSTCPHPHLQRGPLKPPQSAISNPLSTVFATRAKK